ncbi:MAG: transporter substrate-binding domain-containing protein, partial [Clostridia bacterium]
MRENLHKKNLCIGVVLFFSLFIILLFQFKILKFENNIANAGNTIKVGFSSMSGLNQTNGSANCYTYEYLLEIAKYTGWEYEFITKNDRGEDISQEECMDLLKNGKIDILGGVKKDAATIAAADFSIISNCMSYNVIMMYKGNSEVYNDFKVLNGMLMGRVKAYDDYQLFEFLRSNNLKFDSDEIQTLRYDVKGINGLDGRQLIAERNKQRDAIKFVEFDNIEDLNYALNSGYIDSMYATNLHKFENDERLLARFCPTELFYCVTKGNEILLNELNKGQDRVLLMNPQFDVDLMQKYFGTYTALRYLLTKEEKAYVNELTQLGIKQKVAISLSAKPFAYIDKSGSSKGIRIDILDYIAQKTAIQFEYIYVDSMDKAYELLCDNKCKIIIGIETSKDIQYPLIDFTMPYLTSPILILLRNGSSKVRIQEIGYVDKVFSISQAIDDYGAKGKLFDSVFDMSMAYLDNKISACIGSTLELQNMITEYNIENCTLSQVVNVQRSYSIGVNKSTDDVMLYTIINKAISQLSSNEINDIVLKNTVHAQVDKVIKFSDILEEYIYWIVGSIVLSFILITLTILYVYRYKSKKRDELSQALYVDNVTGLWNLNKFRIEANKVIEKQNVNKALATLDIYKFRLINENYGRDKGDKTLKALGECILDSLENGELVCRAYSDRFVLLLNYEGKEKLEKKYEDFIEVVEKKFKEEFSINITITGFIYKINSTDNDVNAMFEKALQVKDSIETPYTKSKLYYYDEINIEKIKEQDFYRNNMEKAIKNKEFTPYYQPKYDINTGEIIGAEALVRWQSSDKGLIMPGRFLPFFEHNG